MRFPPEMDTLARVSRQRIHFGMIVLKLCATQGSTCHPPTEIYLPKTHQITPSQLFDRNTTFSDGKNLTSFYVQKLERLSIKIVLSRHNDKFGGVFLLTRGWAYNGYIRKGQFMKPLRILIPVFSPATGTWGGLTRVLAVARAAQSAGHTLAFCASGPLAVVLREHGYTVYPTPPSSFFGLPRFISRIIEKRSQEASIPVQPGKSVGSMWIVFMVSGMTRQMYLQKALHAEWMAAMDFEADALFTDLDPAAFLLSVCSGLPIASCFQTVVQQGVGSLPWKIMNRSVAAVLRSQGQAPITVDSVCFDPHVLKIVPSIPELDGGKEGRSDLHFVGQLLGELKPASAETAFSPQPGKRYVFVYTGTGSVSLSTIREVLPQVFSADGPLQAVVAGQSIYQTHRIGGVEFRPFVSANEILPHCDWTICHGGQNTIIQSLMHGVPLMVIPGAVFERRFNAEMVQKAGAGKMGELPDFNPDWIRSVLAEREPLAKRASELGNKIKSYGGPAEAVTALEEWATSHSAPYPLPSPH